MNPFALGVRAYAAYNAARFLDVRVLGKEHLPTSGPAIVAARHYHHLYDGAVLVDRLPRQPHVFVALDWTQSRGQRLFMETLCNLAEWPIALRTENLRGGVASAFAQGEARRYMRVAAERTRSLLQRGEIVAIFPEGYPTIDPSGSLKADDDAFLPFAQGLGAIAQRARNDGVNPAIVPVGFAYQRAANDRWSIVARIGAALPGDTPVSAIETAVRELSHR